MFRPPSLFLLPQLQHQSFRPMRRHFIEALPLLSSPQQGKGGDVLTGQIVLGSPLPFTNHRQRYTPSGVLGQLQSGRGAQPCRFTSDPRVSPSLTLQAFLLRAGDADWPLLSSSNFSFSHPQNKANPPCRSGIFGSFRSLGVDFQRHILIGSLGRSAFSGTSS